METLVTNLANNQVMLSFRDINTGALTGNTEFHSYGVKIAENKDGKIYIDSEKWNYSNTTIKYLCKLSIITMNSTVISENKTALQIAISDFKQLTKVGLSLSVVFSSVAGYLLAVEVVNYTTLFLLAIGGFFMVGASNAYNQIIEIDTDKLMQRTKNRPVFRLCRH